MAVALVPIGAADRTQFDTLFRDYASGISSIAAQAFHYDPRSLDHYWRRDDHHPLFIVRDADVVGFALVRPYPSEPAVYDMDQFYVAPEVNGAGVGRSAFLQCLARFPGRWLTRVMPENKPALAFWRRVIDRKTHGNYTMELAAERGRAMFFIRYSSEAVDYER